MNYLQLLERLELTKCSHYTIHCKFNKDGTVTTNERFDDVEIMIQQIN